MIALCTHRLSIFVSLEGGFTAPEVETATSAGLRQVNLGLRIMCAETAGIVACTICMYELGQLHPVDSEQETNTV